MGNTGFENEMKLHCREQAKAYGLVPPESATLKELEELLDEYDKKPNIEGSAELELKNGQVLTFYEVYEIQKMLDAALDSFRKREKHPWEVDSPTGLPDYSHIALSAKNYDECQAVITELGLLNIPEMTAELATIDLGDKDNNSINQMAQNLRQVYAIIKKYCLSEANSEAFWEQIPPERKKNSNKENPVDAFVILLWMHRIREWDIDVGVTMDEFYQLQNQQIHDSNLKIYREILHNPNLSPQEVQREMRKLVAMALKVYLDLPDDADPLEIYEATKKQHAEKKQ